MRALRPLQHVRTGRGALALLAGGLLWATPMASALARVVLDLPPILADTGQTTCYNDTGPATPEPTTHPRQDCTVGRDAAAAAGVLTKVDGFSRNIGLVLVVLDRPLPSVRRMEHPF